MFGALLCCLLSAEAPAEKPPPPAPQWRVWTDASGQYKVEAELVEFDGTEVRLRRADGTTIEVAANKLSEEDRAFLETHSPFAKHDPKRPTIGVRVIPLKDALPALTDGGTPRPSVPSGAVVVEVLPESPAQKAGLKPGDVICQLDGDWFRNDLEAVKFADRMKVGVVHAVKFLRLSERKGRGASKLHWQSETVQVSPEPSRVVAKRAEDACPLELTKAQLVRMLGDPAVGLAVRNVCNQNVVAYEVRIQCFNRFDEPVRGLDGTNVAKCLNQVTIEPGKTGGRNVYWSLDFRHSTSKVTVSLERVRLADGSEWTPTKGQTVSIQAESTD